MHPKVRAIIEKHIDSIEKLECTAAVEEALKEQVLDELIDVLHSVGLNVPPETVTKCLYEFYFPQAAHSAEERERCRLKLEYLINKHQIIIAKNMEIPSK